MAYKDKEKQLKNRRQHYINNKQYYVDKARRFDKQLKAWFVGIRAKLECKECGENHPACLDFHHRDPSDKYTEVSTMVRKGHARRRILKEISKCDVLCANCHRKLHYSPVAQLEECSATNGEVADSSSAGTV